MQITTRQTPAFGVARLELTGGESIRAESGSMMAMASDVNLASKAEGGVMKSLKRAALGGESFFISTYTAPAHGGWVDVAARLPGDIAVLSLAADNPMMVQKGSWLAAEQSVQLDTQWGGFKNMFGSEGAFILRAEGAGELVVAAYGAIETWELAPGQTVTLDTGHMVAYDASVDMQIRKATGGLVQTFKSGEGLVFDVTGPGKLLVQTRNPNEFLGWITATLGTGNSSEPSGAAGIVGGLLGRD
ncbi:MAG: TIGR00266 family protein [Acidimicrobiales bacterium]